MVQLYKIATSNPKDDVTIHAQESKRTLLPWWEGWPIDGYRFLSSLGSPARACLWI